MLKKFRIHVNFEIEAQDEFEALTTFIREHAVTEIEITQIDDEGEDI